jgi:hypothetical protein
MNSRRAGAWLIASAVALLGCTGQPKQAPEPIQAEPKPYDEEVATPAAVKKVETPEGVAVEVDELPSIASESALESESASASE